MTFRERWREWRKRRAAAKAEKVLRQEVAQYIDDLLQFQGDPAVLANHAAALRRLCKQLGVAMPAELIKRAGLPRRDPDASLLE